MIPSGFIQDLLTRIDIVDVVGRHVDLKKAGINHKGLCPFHGEKTPSFIVSPARQTYHCFGCGVHGDAVRFLTDHVGMGFVEAVEELAQQVGMRVPDDERTPGDREIQAARRQQAASLCETLARAAAHYKKQLKASPDAVAYLKGRGLTGEIAARYGIGFAPAGQRSLASAFPSYEDPQLEDCGLVIVQDRQTPQERRYDRFRQRIMFPIRSVKGEVIGFGGRVLDASEPKYLNSPETPVLTKGRELYGLFEARTAIRRAGYALVVEGYMDVVALAQSGLEHAVATLGTACTPDHVRALVRFTDSVVFSFDGDAAGLKAAARALQACLPHATDTRSFRFLFLPSEHDPDSFVRKLGAPAFEAAVANAVALSRQMVVLAQAGCDMETPEGRSRFSRQALPLWSELPQGILRQQMMIEFARVAGMPSADLESLWAALAESGVGRSSQAADETGGRPAGAAQGAPTEAAAWGQGVAPGLGGQGRGKRPGRGSTDWTARQVWQDPLRRGSAPAGSGLRRSPRKPADWATQLLLRHPAWWHELSLGDLDLLHALPHPHSTLLRWLERDIEAQGPRPWAAVEMALKEAPELDQAWSQLQAWEADDTEASLGALRLALDHLHLDSLQTLQTELADRAATDPVAMARYQEVFARWKALKQALQPNGSSAPKP